ncbi:MAG: TlpA disulfide reductase family protein [Pseudomonadota bacterium]
MRRLLIALLFTCFGLVAHAQEPQSAGQFFSISLPDQSGRAVPLAEYKGKPLIVNFWARWCIPCREEIPELRAVAAAHRAKGLTVLGIGLEDNVPNVQDFIKAYEMDYPLLFAQAQGIELMKTLGNTKAGLPFTVFIDHNGLIVGHKLGRISRSQLDAVAATLLQ